jgi:hypothetical protein
VAACATSDVHGLILTCFCGHRRGCV